MKTSFNLIIFVFCCLMGNTLNCSAQNVALHKQYKLSALPNYPHSAPSSDKSSLTDGILTKIRGGYFWTFKTTVGWQNKSNIKIKIDLGVIQSVETITFSTAAGTAGVYFPQNIYVFTSSDNKEFQYEGDLTTSSKTLDTSYGTYRKKVFDLNGLSCKARYVLIEVIPRNNYLFCDEIEILKGDNNIHKRKGTAFRIERIDQTVDSLKLLEHDRKTLSRLINSLPHAVVKSSGINQQVVREEPSQSVMNGLGKEFGSYLKEIFNTSWVVGKLNPWDTVSQFYRPGIASDSIGYQLSLPVNGAEYGAFTLTNSSSLKQFFSFKINSDERSDNDIELFEVPFVPTSNGKMIADPLVPIQNGIGMEPGLTNLIFFKLTGKKSGDYSDDIIIEGNEKSVKVKINSKVYKIAPPAKTDELGVNVWAYFNYPMLKDRKDVAIRDLIEHHVNTLVVHTSAIPYINSNNFQILKSYLDSAGDFDKIFLFNNYLEGNRRNGYAGGQFLSKEWKQYFIKWYGGILRTLQGLGYSNDQVYFYPYDEVTGAKNINDYVALVKWAKENVRGIRFYATINNSEALQRITPLMDIIQVHPSDSLVKILPKQNAQVWSYEGLAPSRELSPYSFYRLMSWRAFANGYEGIGFWNYAASDSNHINLPLLNPSTDYSVIYTGYGKAMYSSRRWEAFRLGIEDYWILNKYRKKFGYQKALILVREVLSNPTNYQLADSIRNIMLGSF